jgi:hypothetical protein
MKTSGVPSSSQYLWSYVSEKEHKGAYMQRPMLQYAEVRDAHEG